MVRLEPDAVVIDDADDGNRNVESSCCNRCYPVECAVRRRIQNIVASYSFDALGLVFRDDNGRNSVHKFLLEYASAIGDRSTSGPGRMGRLGRRPIQGYSTISTMRRVRGSTRTVRPFTTVYRCSRTPYSGGTS